MTGPAIVIKPLRRTAFLTLTITVIALGAAGCTHAPESEAAPPPRANAQPLPPVQGKQQAPELPKLKGDTRP